MGGLVLIREEFKIFSGIEDKALFMTFVSSDACVNGEAGVINNILFNAVAVFGWDIVEGFVDSVEFGGDRSEANGFIFGRAGITGGFTGGVKG